MAAGNFSLPLFRLFPNNFVFLHHQINANRWQKTDKMAQKKKIIDSILPYDADVFCINCRQHLKKPVIFKAYKFIDRYFEFLEANSIHILGYCCVSQSNDFDTIYIAYKPAHCNRELLVAETKRFFKSLYRKNVIILEMNCRLKLPYNTKFKIVRDYVFSGFTIRMKNDGDAFKAYLLNVLHLNREYADIHVENMDIISDFKWKSRLSSNNVFNRYPANIDDYVSSLYCVDCEDKEDEKALKNALLLYLRFKEHQKEIAKRPHSACTQETKDTISGQKCDELPSIQFEKELDAKKIRIDIEMDDISEFLEFLENRVPERHRRKRYIESIVDLYAKGWNEYKHSTFIDDHKYWLNPEEIEIFLNGMKSKDFKVSVKEYEESMELYLSYRFAKHYSLSTSTEEKDEAIPPILKNRKNENFQSLNDSQKENGKHIFATIQHLESWTREKNAKHDEKPLVPTTQYIGESVGERKSNSLRNATVSEDKDAINITFNFNNTNNKNPMHDEKETHIIKTTQKKTIISRIIDFIKKMLNF